MHAMPGEGGPILVQLGHHGGLSGQHLGACQNLEAAAHAAADRPTHTASHHHQLRSRCCRFQTHTPLFPCPLQVLLLLVLLQASTSV